MKSGAAWCRLVQIGTTWSKLPQLGATWCLVPPELAQPENFPHLDEVKVTVNEDPPTAEEMEHVLKTFENNKGAGTGKLKIEGLKLI